MTADVAEKTAAPQSHAFQAEVSRLLHLMVHSVYSNRDIFLRELISNAADACEKLRFEALSNPELTADGGDIAITLTVDADASTLTVADRGIGMTRQELIDNLGTIAKSGTRAYLDALKAKGEAKETEGKEADNARLIGQFGVGFYAAFMVADRVDVVSRRAGAPDAWRWSSDGKGAFSTEAVALEDAPARGTQVVLHLMADAKSYAEPTTIERIVKEYSAHVPVPIELIAPAEAEDADDGAETPEAVPTGPTTRTLTDGSALWVKPKGEVSADEHTEFYRTVSGGWDEPAVTLHYRAEGRTDYKVLVYVPSQKPFDLFDPERKGRVKLYVRRVFITDDAPIVPSWLRFVRGVVDSDDLPLNLSREMLQSNPILETIKKGVTSKVVSELIRLADKDTDTFVKIWDAFGPVIKEGLYEDPERRDDLFKLVRFKTTAGDGWRSLADYVAALRENQTKIFYVVGDSPDAVKASPHLEGFRARGVEVLLLTDPVDAFWVRTALGFDGKGFQSITQGSADLDLIPTLEKDDTPAEQKAAREAGVAALIAALKDELKDAVSDVRASARLAESAVCLVAGDFGMDKQMEKIMSRHQGGAPGLKPILEVNPKHPLIVGLAEKLGGLDAETKADAAHLLHGQARILDGDAPTDPAGFVRRMGKVMEKVLG